MAGRVLRGPINLKAKQSTSSSSVTMDYIIVGDDQYDEPISLSATVTGLPRMYSPYRLGNGMSPFLVLKDVDWEYLGKNIRKGWYCVYRATLSYGERDSETNDSSRNEAGEPQEEDSYSFSSSWEVIKRVFDIDMDGKRVCNSAGEDFTRPVEVDERIKINRLTRVEGINSSYNPNPKANEFTGTVNSKPIWGFPAGEVLMEILCSRSSQGRGWTVDYNMRTRKGGWDIEILDQGFNYGIDAESLYPFQDKDGQPVTTPQLLDGHGLNLLEGQPPVYLRFKQFASKDFSLLNIPNWFFG